MNQSSRAAPRVYIETYGCQMNAYDTAAMHGILASAGFGRTDQLEEADAILLNTCSVREHAEHRVLSRVGELKRRLADRLGNGRRERTVIGICGCMAERLGQEITLNGNGIDLVVGVDQYDQLPELLRAQLTAPPAVHSVATGHRSDVHYVAPVDAYPQNNSHLVTIHKGCDYRCTYCVVPDTRGPQREKSPAAIVREIEAVVHAGGTEVTLLGQNVTAYRWHDELDFAGLLRCVARIDGLQRIRFLTGHPRDMTDAVIECIATEPLVCPSLHIPMQSGSDRVLRRMKRLYTRADYLAMITKARARIPDVTFSSDFIVGFPGETEGDFWDTLEVLREVRYDQVFSFKYSERPGTPASRLPDDVPLAVKKKRLAELQETQNAIWRNLAAAQIGQVWQGVIEAPARRPAGAWRLRTSNNRKVLLEHPNAGVGEEWVVRITGFDHSTFRGVPLTKSR